MTTLGDIFDHHKEAFEQLVNDQIPMGGFPSDTISLYTSSSAPSRRR